MVFLLVIIMAFLLMTDLSVLFVAMAGMVFLLSLLLILYLWIYPCPIILLGLPPCENKNMAALLSTTVASAPDTSLSKTQNLLLQMHEYIAHLRIDDMQCLAHAVIRSCDMPLSMLTALAKHASALSPLILLIERL
jgi:hypothetical protein